jgi:hypothetical protein
MQHSFTQRTLLTGTLAGACIGLTFLLGIVLLLGVGVAWQYAFTSNVPIIGEGAWGAVVQDLGRLPSFLWSWRWIVAGLVATGALLALVETIALRLPQPWRDRFTPSILQVLIGIAVLSTLLLGSDQALYAAGAQRETLPSLSTRQPGAWNLVMVGLPVVFGVGGALWLYWSWWNARWRDWLRVSAPADERTIEPGADSWFAQRHAQERARIGMAIGAVASAILLFVAVSGYDQVRTAVVSGELWVEPAGPERAVQLAIAGTERLLLVENTFGAGTVEVTLTGRDGAPAAPPVVVTFNDARVSFERTSIGIDALQPGVYQLNARLTSGSGGRVGYALIERDQTPATVMALLVGLSGGLVVALATAVAGSILAAREKIA